MADDKKSGYYPNDKSGYRKRSYDQTPRWLENVLRNLANELRRSSNQTQQTSQPSQPVPTVLEVCPFGNNGDYRLFIRVASDDKVGVKTQLVITEGSSRKQVVSTDDAGLLLEFELLEFKEEKRHITVEVCHSAFMEELRATGKSPLFWEMDLAGSPKPKTTKPEPVTFTEANGNIQRNAGESEGSFLKRFFTETRRLVKKREEII